MILKEHSNCSIFITAGYPHLNSALEIVPALATAGVDFIELGIPFSDPMADGTVIQEASAIALKNGMNINLLFEQVETLKKQTAIPIILMGYFNPIHSFGLTSFLNKCSKLGVDGVIIPDLPIEAYEMTYQPYFEASGVPMIFLMTPSTSIERIKQIEANSKAFIYLVASTAVTGNEVAHSQNQTDAFKTVANLNLKVPLIAGFGIHNKATFQTVCKYFSGAIIGSAFIKHLGNGGEVKEFVAKIIR